MLVSPRKQKATVGVGEVLLSSLGSLGSGKGWALPAVPDLRDKKEAALVRTQGSLHT